ncbi:DegT/DnrJ/EryC1/StrS family aminotransferase [Nitrospiraceae bacterium AH_259_D15_M11_P09]|nr:DegT/DnrJ/EryC1/StrS family aminotransferase [Nitrospiraceae bacterium AH_259_D15_M11_P09]
MIPIFAPVFKERERDLLLECIDTGWISSQGRFIPYFEEQFAAWNGMRYGVATSSCTTALHLVLVSLGIGPGDEVLCPDLTFIAPANMIRLAGLKPVFVDVEEPGWGLNPEHLEHKVNPRTRAVMVVHPLGHAADMDPIMELAREHGLKVIEDVAEAPGAEYKGRRVGTFGDASCYSFFANKIMTTGEGGIILTNDPELNEWLRIYRDHGMSRKERYVPIAAGFNYRMTNMQAAVGVAQMERLDEILQVRARQAEVYKGVFADNPRAVWRPVAEWCRPVHWMATITLRDASLRLRDPLLAHMREKGIDCRQMVYPVHMAEPYKEVNDPEEFPVSTSVSLRSLHLPSSLGLKPEEIKYIAETALEWLDRHDN